MIASFFRELFHYVPWKVETYGDDIVLKDVWATAFGTDDPEDSGKTASGLDLNKHPNFRGVALPMRVASIKSLRYSPLPFMPYGVSSTGRYKPEGTFVIIEDEKSKSITNAAPLVDIGPSLWTGVGVDLSVALARNLDSTATAINFKRRVTVKILNGAKYL